MKLKSRGFLIGLIIVLIIIVTGGGYLYLNNPKDENDKKDKEEKKLVLKESEIYEGNTKKRPLNTGVFVLTDDIKSVKGTYAAFTSIGYDVLSGNFKEYEKNLDYNGAFIFTEEMLNSLSKKEIEKIKQNIENGQNAIITGKSKLSKAIGIDSGYDKKVNSYIMKGHEKENIEIKNGMDASQFEAPKGFETIAKNTSDGTAVMVVGNVGKGRVIYSSGELAPKSGSGYEYFPFLLETVNKEFKITPAYSRNNGAIYVDIGYHFGVDTPAELAERAKSWGYDQINVGAWSSMNKDHIAYYKGIIEEAHKRGIKVFAWFELPMVSIDFWNEHPEWRQKTASGADGKVDWRYLMALENEDCFNAAKEYIKDIMERFDFDGIDIAEMYYESPNLGFEDPSVFTPMNDAFRENFKKKHGFDPKDSFNSKSEYYWKTNEDAKNKIIKERIDLVYTQHKEMLDLVEEIKKDKPDLGTNVTVIDSIAAKGMEEDIGVDASELVKLQNEYNFVLNIEDPFTLWTLGSERYSLIGESYRKIMGKDEKLYIDINIVERKVGAYPTKKQRGVEVYSLIHNASKFTDKVIMYSLASPEKEDMFLAPYAYAYDVIGKEIGKNTYEFDSKHNFIWHLDMKGKEVYIDDKKYPVYTEDTIVVPKGRRKVEIKDAKEKGLGVTDISADIKSATYEGESIVIEYDSYGRCFINVDKKPSLIKIDGKEVKPEIKEFNGTYTVILPKGEHTATIK